MNKQLKYAIYLCGFALCVMGFLHQHPFFSEVSQTIPATVYMDGVAVEETTVTMEGKRTNYVFHDNERYTGAFAIDSMEWTTRDTQSVRIAWGGDYGHLQTIQYWNWPHNNEEDIGYFMVISDHMTQFGLQRTDGAFIATSPEVLAVMETYFTGHDGISANQIPPLEDLVS